MFNNKKSQVLLIITIIVIVWFTSISEDFEPRERKYLENRRKQIDPKKTKQIKMITSQTSRWSAAAQQDTSPAIALMHANYGAAYLMALNDIATHTEILVQ